MELSEHLQGLAQDILVAEREGADRKRDWVVVLGLTPTLDGHQWCFLWGEDISMGVAAFGDTPYEAMLAFDKEMYSRVNAEKGEWWKSA